MTISKVSASDVLESEAGLILIEANDVEALAINFVEHAPETLNPNNITHLAKAQLQEYILGKRTEFDFPMHIGGTQFQHEVWSYLLTIPYGETVSYQDIAHKIGRPKAVRAVGAANGANPLGIVVPCHRVIGKNGKLTGYAGGLDKKQWLLELENR